MRSLIAIALVLALTLPAAALAAGAGSRRDAGRTAKQPAEPWIHVEVREAGGKDASVNINLPLALARAALAATDGIVEQHLKFGGETGLKISDLRRIWAEARRAGNAEFVSVESSGETIRVFRQNEFVHINVDAEGERAGKPAKVRVRMPVVLVDALLSGKGEQLDVVAAFGELEKAGPGEIVRVEDGADVVRIWIDHQSAQTD